MKRLIPIFVGIFAMVIVGISFTFAWYTNRQSEDSTINAKSEGITFTYNINDVPANDSDTYTYTYDITSLTFFDIDNTNELSYFESMATCITIELTNTSNKAIDINVVFTSDSILEYTKVTSPVESNVSTYYELTGSITTDTTIDTSKTYYTYNETSGYAVVESPSTDNISTYYEVTGVLTTDTEVNSSKAYYEISSNSYVECVFSDKDISTSSATTIEDLINSNISYFKTSDTIVDTSKTYYTYDETSGYAVVKSPSNDNISTYYEKGYSISSLSESSDTSTEDTSTFYIYLFGVQEIDSATNDFLDKTYSFSITLNATKSSSTTSEEE